MWIVGWNKGQAGRTAKDPLPEKRDGQKWENLLEDQGDTPAVCSCLDICWNYFQVCLKIFTLI